MFQEKLAALEISVLKEKLVWSVSLEWEVNKEKSEKSVHQVSLIKFGFVISKPLREREISLFRVIALIFFFVVQS